MRESRTAAMLRRRRLLALSVALAAAATIWLVCGASVTYQWRSWPFGWLLPPVVLVENECAMSYMNPEYVRVPHVPHAKYAVYLYSERSSSSPSSTPGVTGAKRLDALRGVPVVFVPGNAGSYKQVRSFAAEAHRAWQRPAVVLDDDSGAGAGAQQQSPPPRPVAEPGYGRWWDDEPPLRNEFDVFAVDFASELSALHGTLLEQQAVFLASAVRRILDLYSDDDHHPPAASPSAAEQPRHRRVLILGHSMGGVVARLAFALDPDWGATSVAAIITLNSPHAGPVASFHGSLYTAYQRSNLFWASRSPAVANVTVISLAGGFRDSLVRSDYAVLSSEHGSVVDLEHGFAVMTTSVPSVWLSADHQCIVWCGQLVRRLVLAVASILDPGTGQLSTLPVSDRLLVLRQLLLSPFPGYFGLRHADDPPSDWAAAVGTPPSSDDTLSLPAQPERISDQKALLLTTAPGQSGPFTLERPASSHVLLASPRGSLPEVSWLFGPNEVPVNVTSRWQPIPKSRPHAAAGSSDLVGCPHAALLFCAAPENAVALRVSWSPAAIASSLHGVRVFAFTPEAIERRVSPSALLSGLVASLRVAPGAAPLVNVTLLDASHMLPPLLRIRCRSVDLASASVCQRLSVYHAVPGPLHEELWHAVSLRRPADSDVYEGELLLRGHHVPSYVPDDTSAFGSVRQHLVLLTDPRAEYEFTFEISWWAAVGAAFRYHVFQLVPMVAAILLLVIARVRSADDDPALLRPPRQEQLDDLPYGRQFRLEVEFSGVLDDILLGLVDPWRLVAVSVAPWMVSSLTSALGWHLHSHETAPPLLVSFGLYAAAHAAVVGLSLVVTLFRLVVTAIDNALPWFRKLSPGPATSLQAWGACTGILCLAGTLLLHPAPVLLVAMILLCLGNKRFSSNSLHALLMLEATGLGLLVPSIVLWVERSVWTSPEWDTGSLFVILCSSLTLVAAMPGLVAPLLPRNQLRTSCRLLQVLSFVAALFCSFRIDLLLCLFCVVLVCLIVQCGDVGKQAKNR